MFRRAKVYKPSVWARLFLVQNWKISLSRKTPSVIKITSAPAVELPCLDVVEIAVRRSILWHNVQIHSKGRVDTFSGVSEKSAYALKNDLLAFINDYLADLIENSQHQLREIDAAIRSMTDAKRQYLAQADVSQALSSVPGNAAQALAHPLFTSALIRAEVLSCLPASLAMLTDPAVRHHYNEAFVAHELNKFAPFFDEMAGVALADEQRQACIRLEDSNLLVASAGSGKSATIVGKVAYVVQKGLYLPEDILVLAFNRSAANSLKARIADQLAVPTEKLGCRVTTFHALGRSIIEQVNQRPPQLANWAESEAGESKFVVSIIEELRQQDADFRALWLDLLTLYPKAELEVSSFSSLEEYESYLSDGSSQQPGQIMTLSGIYVKSMQERQIANWLWRQSVDFQYEAQVAIPTPDDPQRTQRYVHPDFYYPHSKTIHEHFAIDVDGTSPFDNYVMHADSKRAGYASIQADFFETTSADASRDVLLKTLASELAKRQIPMHARPDEEVLAKVSKVVVTHFHKIICICVKHIRANRLSLDMLLKKAETLHDKKRASHFARVVWQISQAYSNKLNEMQCIDFDSMIGDAVQMIESGRYQSPYSLILVDEFQDISEPRANLIKALKLQKPFAKLFAVGDDWQSIYRFTGSNITIFTDFKTWFGASWLGLLQSTYRCNQMLAETAATFVQKNPEQLKKSIESSRPAIPKSIRVIPVRVFDEDVFLSEAMSVLDRLDAFLEGQRARWHTPECSKLKVLVLWRYNRLGAKQRNWPLFQNIEVTGLSFHRSKGLEADYTILLDVSEGDYGVPSQIEEDELLNLVIPRPESYPYAEERRLFYVAMTRASRGVFLLCNMARPSRYVRELVEIAGTNVQFETADGQPLVNCPKCLSGVLVSKKKRNASEFFDGCSTYPSCRYTTSGG